MSNKNYYKIENRSRKAHLITLKKFKILKKNYVNKKFLENLLGFKIKETSYLIKRINYLKLEYHKLTNRDSEKLNLILLERIISNQFSKTGKNKIQAWENGWKENLNEINQKKHDSILPKYYSKNSKFFRLKGSIVYSKNFKFNAELQELIHLSVINTFNVKIKNIYEFGAGSGNVITRLMKAFKSKYNYYACDWTSNSIKILNKIRINNLKIKSFKFNFFKPKNSLKLQNNSLVLTNGALEQIGKNHKQFVNFLLNKRPSLIINFEPICDFYTKENLNDFILKLYSKKRNYLDGYFGYLKVLEKKKIIKIIKYQRVGGGVYSEPLSFVIWKKI